MGSTGYGSKQRVIVGIAILALGVAALFTGLFGHVASAVLIVGAGVLLVFLGVSVLGRTIALPLSRIIGAPLPRLRGVTGRLARENAMRNPKRTAASASALMIGVGLVVFITIFAASTTASVNASIDRTFTGDMVIDSGAGMAGGVDPGLAQRLNALPQVAAATGVRNGAAEILGKVEQITAVIPGRPARSTMSARCTGRSPASARTASRSTRMSRRTITCSSAIRCRSCSGTPGRGNCGLRSSTVTAWRHRRPATSSALPPTTPTSPPATTARCS